MSCGHRLQEVDQGHRVDVEIDEDEPFPRVDVGRNERKLRHSQRPEALAVGDSLENAGQIPRPAVVTTPQFA